MNNGILMSFINCERCYYHKLFFPYKIYHEYCCQLDITRVPFEEFKKLFKNITRVFF